MEENNRKGPGVFYAVIGVATLVVAIIGATFAYFSANAENTTDVTGNTANKADLTLVVERVSDTATAEKMIPMKDDLLQTGVTGTDTKSCIDANGNTACQVYKITLENKGTAALTISGNMALTSVGTIKNMKWQLIENATTVGTVGTPVLGTAEGVLADKVAYTAGETKEYYVVVWLSDTGAPQEGTDAGQTFTGTVTFDAVGADGSTNGLTATFSAAA